MIQELNNIPQQGAVNQIMQLVGQIPDIAEKQATKQAEDTANQTKLYQSLRQSGYAPEDAADRVNRTYRSTNFIQGLIGGNSNAFEVGTEPDQVEQEQLKASTEANAKIAEAFAKQAEAKKFSAQADYYAAGGKYAHNDNLTPNQIQMRIKDLRGQVGMGTQEEDQSINGEIGYLNDLFNKKSGFKGQGTSTTKQSTGKYQPGQTVYYQGKPVTIKSVNDDGTYNV